MIHFPFVVVISLAMALATSGLSAQTRIDGSMPFQSDTAKKYALFIPSGYDAGTPAPMMLGLHPFNTNRWDSKSWCDTLMAFAEANQLILVCPDGGVDGQIDDDIDTAFTSFLLDSVHIWYNVDTARRYVMGFSWGGQTTYTYGLRHRARFCGFMPIGSAMGGTTAVDAVLSEAAALPFYIIHGSNDAPALRFTPIRDSLLAHGAEVEALLMTGVGHTIDFPNRNAILTAAYEWIDSVGCSNLTSELRNAPRQSLIELHPNPASAGGQLSIIGLVEFPVHWVLTDLSGRQVHAGILSDASDKIHLSDQLHAGSYILHCSEGAATVTVR